MTPERTSTADPVAADGPGPVDRDRRVLRRAVRAGALTAVALAVLTGAANIAFGGDGVSAAIWVSTSAVVGTLVTSGWMVLTLVLDLIAGEVPSRRRAVWTAALFAVAFLAPIVPAAMLQVAAGR
ncbi:hypothetical protein [Euzebya sp.]|uniref:hypothetical protein n=1 Tax=Euzebya sp. TaxID=1971409 RepID=UPI003517E096